MHSCFVLRPQKLRWYLLQLLLGYGLPLPRPRTLHQCQVKCDKLCATITLASLAWATHEKNKRYTRFVSFTLKIHFVIIVAAFASWSYRNVTYVTLVWSEIDCIQNWKKNTQRNKLIAAMLDLYERSRLNGSLVSKKTCEQREHLPQIRFFFFFLKRQSKQWLGIARAHT